MAERSFAQQSNAFVAAHQQNGQNGQDDGYKMPTREITPEALPKVTHGVDPFITGEFIYWKAYEDGLDYATTGIAPATTSVSSRGNVKNPGSEWEPGFKLGLGLKFRHDGWDLYANWTWLSEFSTQNSASASAQTAIYSTWDFALPSTPGVTGTTGTASGKWSYPF